MAKKSGTEILEAVASAINGEMHPFPVPWAHRFATVELDAGTKIFVEVDETLAVSEKPIRYLVDRVVQWLRLQQNPDWFLNVKRAAEAVEMYRSISTPLDSAAIKPVRWLTEVGYTWRRLPWDPSEGPTPTWDGLLKRMTNQEAFKAFLGSLFFDDAKQHQYGWMYGLGSDGKGAINRFLKRIFGRVYRSKQPPAPNDKFWTYGLIGSRIVVFPDCNAQTFTSSGMFKSLSGGDPVDVEAKGQMSFTTALECKFLFLSNEKPSLSSENADMRRIIYCEFVEKPNASTPGFEDQLWDEGGHFLTKCLQQYAALCPNHEDIKTEREGITDWVSVVEEKFELLFEKYFKLPHADYREHKGLAILTLLQVDLVTVKPELLQDILWTENLDKKEQKEFRMWLERKYGVQKRSIGLLDSMNKPINIKRYVGICRNSSKMPSKASNLYNVTY